MLTERLLRIALPIVVALCAIRGTSAYAEVNERPNIVMIIVDTLRADHLGCYGYRRNVSPEIDNLAARGVRFSEVISQSSWTRPSIGSFLTSQYPRTLGIYREWEDILPNEFTTLAEALHDSGYATFGITANPNINARYNFAQGFDQYIDSTFYFNWMRRDLERPLADKHKVYADHASTTLQNTLKSLASFSENAAPVYVQINVMDMHDTQYFPTALIDRDLAKTPTAAYDQSLRNVSREIGKFITQLTKIPKWKDTLFVIVSDHGEGLLDHQAVQDPARHGNLLYRSNVSVPLILFNPNRPNFRALVNRPVRLLDLMPTVLDYAKVAAPPSLQGRSLLPLVKDPAADIGLPAHIFTETNWRSVDKVAVYSGGLEYIENRDGWTGVNPHELQSKTVPENGVKTDIIKDANLSTLLEIREKLHEYEARFPKAPAKGGKGEFSHTEIDQLKTLGYLN